MTSLTASILQFSFAESQSAWSVLPKVTDLLTESWLHSQKINALATADSESHDLMDLDSVVFFRTVQLTLWANASAVLELLSAVYSNLVYSNSIKMRFWGPVANSTLLHEVEN